MIDAAVVFTRGGQVVWSFRRLRINDVINEFIQQILLEERVSNEHLIKPFYFKCTVINDLDVIILVAYEMKQPLESMGEVLKRMKQQVLSKWNEIELILTKKMKEPLLSTNACENLGCTEYTYPHVFFLPGLHELSGSLVNVVCDVPAVKGTLASRKEKKKDSVSQNSVKDTTQNVLLWKNQKVTKKAMEALDFSKDGSKKIDTIRRDGMDPIPEPFCCDFVDESDTDDDDSSKGFWGTFANVFNSLTGKKELTDDDVFPALKEFEVSLMEKNVSVEVTEKLTDSIRMGIRGIKLGTMRTIRQLVREKLSGAITNILTPKHSIDILKGALAAKAESRVYSIVFLGINGVGKSTSLAKICYLMKTKGKLNVMIAACDTFRAGAVEQLRIHSTNLGVHLFEKGYGKDAALIAREALCYAKVNGFDVVLIDTAGRMQDNEPLMRALSKLVNLNNPDFVLFVGEALVGKDGSDQIFKFNQALTEMTGDSFNGRGIDGILLTKFDTVDDKVGAALTMAYTTGQPIIYVGTGQSYTNLRRLNVSTVVKALLN